MEERKKGVFLGGFFSKKHMAIAVPALRSSKTERGSAARRLVQHKVRIPVAGIQQKHAQSREPLAEKLHCVRVSVASRLFPVTIRTAKFHPDVCVLFCYLSSQNKSKY